MLRYTVAPAKARGLGGPLRGDGMQPVSDAEQPASDARSAEAAAPVLTRGPLQGLVAVEFGQLLAGPYVGTLLGDFGMDVIKIEPPPRGDAMREWGRLRHNGHSLWWSILARNKRSV